MKHVLIIGSRHAGTKNDPIVLANSLADQTVKTTLIYWEDIVIRVLSGEVSVSSSEGELSQLNPDLVISVGWYKSGAMSLYRDVAFATALYLDSKGIRFWNREMIQQRSTSKLSCMVQLALNGVPVPDTNFSLSNSVIDDQPLPFIAKAAAASRGRANYMIDTEESRSAIDKSEAHFLVQPLLENDHDLRVICMGGEAQLILKRSRDTESETHLNNISQGAKGEWLTLTDVNAQLLTISQKACRILGRDLAGIDFIPDLSSPFGYSCLEVNAIPQLTSGQDVDIKMTALIKTINEMNI
jgi:glutathione synthase/RimK-type ligase-like ATP-grasp enzyme